MLLLKSKKIVSIKFIELLSNMLYETIQFRLNMKLKKRKEIVFKTGFIFF